MPPKEKYTDPKLRDQVKEEIHQSDKGGQPGQWSARKAQMMAAEYKKRGGDYNTDKSEKDQSQKNLSKWGEEDWQTKEGSGNAKQADGTEKRYLPKKAWEKMSEEEKQATDDKKLAASKEGQQHVDNTSEAKNARSEANQEAEDKQSKQSASDKSKAAKSKTQAKDQKKDKEDGDDKDASAGTKRKTRSATKNENAEQSSPNKAQKTEESSSSKSKSKSASQTKSPAKGQGKHTDEDNTFGSKRQSADAPAAQGSKDRLPKKGQSVHWKSMPGWVEGEVLEVAHESTEVEGTKVNAKKNDPRIVLKSKNGKVAVHKPDAVYFD
ncbi:hypothetical protein MBLNU457_g0641t1 [Dothideomycetes sp. NU457]